MIQTAPANHNFSKKTIHAYYIRKYDGSIASRHFIRSIAVINGYLFYKSTGQNSRQADTWFPFLGLAESAVPNFCAKGWYIKPGYSNELKAFLSPILGHSLLYNDLPSRFGNITALLISANLGGGFWDTEKGREVKSKLDKLFPSFFDNISINLIGYKPQLKRQKTLQFAEQETEEFNTWARKISNKDAFELPGDLHDFLAASSSELPDVEETKSQKNDSGSLTLTLSLESLNDEQENEDEDEDDTPVIPSRTAILTYQQRHREQAIEALPPREAKVKAYKRMRLCY